MSSAGTAEDGRPVGRFAPFRHKGFSLYWASLLLSVLATQIQTVAVGWQIYDMTRDPFDLGLVGLSQFAPALLLVLVTGAVADRFPRRRILGTCLAIQSACAGGFVWLTSSGIDATGPIFALLVVFGAARAFYNPARQAIVPNLVPARELPVAITLNNTAMQAAMICGPVAGGLLYGLSPNAAYVVTLVMLAIAAVLVLSIPQPAQRRAPGYVNWESVSAGMRYVWSNKVLLGAVSLDLFAVFLGGAAALLPVYARDILEVGPTGLGVLRSAQAVGAIGMGVVLILYPITDHAGRIMFAAVFAFGIFTLVFGLSETLWLSVAALALMGAADMVSVSVRSTLIQLWTPDELRGRVNAVNQVFIGASNELGGFRAGTMAALVGPVVAVTAGAVGTLAVAGLWTRAFPRLVSIRQLTRP